MSTTAPKPSLTGVRIRARKGAVKAQAKHEPTIFRDQLLKHISATPPGDWDALYERLVAAGGQGNLELLKYADEMFDVLIIGGLLQPGGDLLQDNAPVCPFALVLQTTDKDVKDGVEVLNKLIRRYKYLQKPLEESSLPKLLQYGHRWPPEQRDRLAQAIGLMLANGLATSAVLGTLVKEHLVKDDVSATLLTLTLKSYLREQPSIDQLAGALRKGGIKDLAPFFVASKRNPTAMGEWFREKGVPQVADWWAKRQTVAARDELVATVKEVAGNEDEGAEAIVAAIKAWQTAHPGALSDPAEALVGAVWPALMASVDWASARPDQVEALALREIGKFAPALEPFCNSAKVQVGLINVVQVYCYEDTRLMKVFPGILKVLYNADCISDKAIIYWHQKGSKPQGKQHFLKATEALVKFLEEQESEDDEE